jgi:hypothetical protein
MSPYKKGLVTDGFSNKVAKTLWGACGAQATALLVNYVASGGSFDRVELAQLVGVALTALGGLVAGYRAAPDEQEDAPAAGWRN